MDGRLKPPVYIRVSDLKIAEGLRGTQSAQGRFRCFEQLPKANMKVDFGASLAVANEDHNQLC